MCEDTHGGKNAGAGTRSARPQTRIIGGGSGTANKAFTQRPYCVLPVCCIDTLLQLSTSPLGIREQADS